jgi:exodeoxyribonuclease VII large subunit
VARERELIADVPDRLTAAITGRLERGSAEVSAARRRAIALMRSRVDAAGNEIGHLRARVAALSPQATLARGYAVVIRDEDGRAVRAPAEAEGPLTIYVQTGSFPAHRRLDA